MYEAHFGLRELPFSLNPDPSFLHFGPNHSKALSILEFGLASESGITVITGEIGAGKTTLLRYLLNTMPTNRTVGLIATTHKAFGELIHWISMAFGLDHRNKDKVELYDQFYEYMIEEYGKGNRVVLIVDEAQNLDAETIEELRVISNINADKNLVLQLVVVGQPELAETLRRPELKQFAQRVSAYYHLEPLDLLSTKLYIKHRMNVAGAERNPFQNKAVVLIHEASKGVPRVINTLCHFALTYCFAEGRKTVSEKLMKQILADHENYGLFGVGTHKESDFVLGSGEAINSNPHILKVN